MRRFLGAVIGLALLAATSSPALAGTRGSDQLFWVPSWQQALEMAQHTGRPIFMLYYTCVGERSATYSGTATVW